MIIALVIFSFTLIGKLANDINLYKGNQAVDHFKGAAYVIVALLTCTFFAGSNTIAFWFFCYWAIFDTSYALLINQKFYYTGTTSVLDQLQNKYPIIKIIKYLGAVGSIITAICR